MCEYYLDGSTYSFVLAQDLAICHRRSSACGEAGWREEGNCTWRYQRRNSIYDVVPSVVTNFTLSLKFNFNNLHLLFRTFPRKNSVHDVAPSAVTTEGSQWHYYVLRHMIWKNLSYLQHALSVARMTTELMWRWSACCKPNHLLCCRLHLLFVVAVAAESTLFTMICDSAPSS